MESMRHKSQSPSLPQVLERHWRDLLHATNISEYYFAATVRGHYEQHVPRAAHTIDWSHHPDATTRMRRDAEKISRWFRDDINARFPVEALEAFIESFPHDRKKKLQQHLATRQGLVAVAIPEFTEKAEGENLGRVAREAGEAIIAISRLMQDGRISADDASDAPMAIVEIDQAVSVLLEMRERIIQSVIAETHKSQNESITNLRMPSRHVAPVKLHR